MRTGTLGIIERASIEEEVIQPLPTKLSERLLGKALHAAQVCEV